MAVVTDVTSLLYLYISLSFFSLYLYTLYTIYYYIYLYREKCHSVIRGVFLSGARGLGDDSSSF